MPNTSLTDSFCLLMDNALRAMFGHSHTTNRPSPAAHIPESDLTENQRHHAAACMRINHAGEVAAQGLYHGQALVSRDETLKQHLDRAAIEEGDHLVWCQQRLEELDSHTSRLTPFWYMGSFLIGSVAGIAGDRWSLGFVAETETQVMKHLESHLTSIPLEDHRSIAILKCMHSDEKSHRDEAIQAGATELPLPIKKLMQFASAVMVKTAYWI